MHYQNWITPLVVIALLLMVTVVTVLGLRGLRLKSPVQRYAIGLSIILATVVTAVLCSADVGEILTVLESGMDRYGPHLVDALTQPSMSAIHADPWDIVTQAVPEPLDHVFLGWMAYLLRNLPFVEMLRVIIVFVSFMLMTPAFFEISIDGISMGRLPRYLARWDQRHREYVAITAIFICGIYLLLAALIAFPWFKSTGIDSSDAAAYADSVAFGEAIGDSLSEPKLSLGSASSQTAGALERLKPDSLDSNASLIRGLAIPEIVRINELRNGTFDDFDALEQSLDDATRQARNLAWQQWRARHYLSMTQQERSIYSDRILSWYLTRRRLLVRRATSARSAANDIGRSLGQWDARIARQVDLMNSGANAAHVRDSLSNENARAWFGAAGPGGRAVAYQDRFELELPADARARVPSPGDEFGPFGLVANWLLRTRSESLAVLTGMLGFGLYGALIARFVQGGVATGVGVQSWGKVIIQGFSAAIVVFLAVQGGLNVFGGGDHGINPYALCLACLVGAVFSDRVWSWARDRIVGTPEHGGGNPGPPPAEPQH